MRNPIVDMMVRAPRVPGAFKRRIPLSGAVVNGVSTREQASEVLAELVLDPQFDLSWSAEGVRRTGIGSAWTDSGMEVRLHPASRSNLAALLAKAAEIVTSPPKGDEDGKGVSKKK